MAEQPPTLEDLKEKYAVQVTQRDKDAEALERVKQDTATAQACVARIRWESMNQSKKVRDIEAEIEADIFYNSDSNLEENLTRLLTPRQYIAGLDAWDQRFVEVEQPKLERAEHQAEIDVLKDEWDLADTRVVMAETKLAADTVTLDAENGGVVVHSALVSSLQTERAQASYRYHTALTAYKDLVTRQDARAAALASVGMITSRQVSHTISRY
jgi:hypothetical protein